MSFKSIAYNGTGSGSDTDMDEPIKVPGVRPMLDQAHCVGCGAEVFKSKYCSGRWHCNKDFDDWFFEENMEH